MGLTVTDWVNYCPFLWGLHVTTLMVPYEPRMSLSFTPPPFSKHLCVSVHVQEHQCGGPWGQLVRIASLLSPWWSQGLTSGCQVGDKNLYHWAISQVRTTLEKGSILFFYLWGLQVLTDLLKAPGGVLAEPERKAWFRICDIAWASL